MQAKGHERSEARRMRARGASLRAIARELGVALSSASVWVRDVRPAPELLSEAGAIRVGLVRLPVWSTAAVRRCHRCSRLLADVAFAPASSRCRRCAREYFAERGDLHRRQSGEARDRRRRRAKQHVVDHLTSRACADCGERDPVVLEFDHLEAKHGTISILAHNGVHPDRLDAEMTLCEVVCVSCHRRRTAARRPAARGRAPEVARALAFVRSVLQSARCSDCGIDEADVLEFDHVDRKTAVVSGLVHGGASTGRIADEIERCDIVCGNCHRRRTAARGRHFRATAAPNLWVPP